jgi:hypothetical protein
MSEPRVSGDALMLAAAKGERYYLEAFLQRFGKAWYRSAKIDAPTGHPLSISREMFKDRKSGSSKIGKRGRAPNVL